MSCGRDGAPEIAFSAHELEQSFTVTHDVRLNAEAPDRNYEGLDQTSIRLIAGYSYAAMRFSSEASLPPGVVVTRAVLTIHHVGRCDAGTRVTLRRLSSEWIPATATWECAADTDGRSTPGCGDGTPWAELHLEAPIVAEFVCPSAPAASRLDIDVTADLLEWLRSGTPHHGWLVETDGTPHRIHTTESALGPTLSITYSAVGIHVPEEPVPPPLDRTAPSNAFDAYRFVFQPASASTGSPPQVGTALDAIVRDRASHLRGSVMLADGSPLEGVSVEVRGQPRLGRAFTRASGVYDMVINGGGPVTLVFRRPDYLEVHRNLQVGWGDDLAVLEVVMTPEPTSCSEHVTSSAGAFLTGSQVCGSSSCSPAATNGWTTTDSRGTRSFGLYVPPLTEALDGESTIPGYRVCMTEYTRGVAGTDRENAMPADIARNTAYTFAVEGQVRRTASAGDRGTLVQDAAFSDEAYLYVRTSEWHGDGEDLRFDPGTAIPMGNFDRVASGWVPSRDGLALEVRCLGAQLVAILPETAELPAEEATALCASGLIDQLGQSATSVWRVPLRHFSPVDCNLAELQPDASGGADSEGGGNGDDSEHCAPGSVLHCEGRAVSETVPLVGTAAGLAYHSAHHAGRGELNTIRVTPAGNPGGWWGSTTASVRVFVAGQNLTPTPISFTSAELVAGRSVEVVWDGRDAFGRRVQGPRLAQIVIRYSGLFSFCANATFPTVESSLNSFGGELLELTCDQGVGRRSWSRVEQALVGTVDDHQRGLGGWAVDVMHTYDPASRLLYYGNGRRRSVESTGMTVRRVTSVVPESGAAEIGGIASDAAGTIYFTLRETTSVFTRASWEGLYRLTRGSSVPELVATDLTDPTDVAVTRDGDVWVSGGHQGCARRYASTAPLPWSGVAVIGECRVGGLGSVPEYGGVPPMDVLHDPTALAVGSLTELAALPDGSLYVVGPTSAGVFGEPLFRLRPTSSGGMLDVRDLGELDGFSPFSLLSGRDDDLLLDGIEGTGDLDRVVRRLDASGAWGRVVGANGAFATQSDFAPQRDVRLEHERGGGLDLAVANGLATDSQGRLYVAQQRVASGGAVRSTARILRVRQGYVETIAGPPSGDDGVDDIFDSVCAATAPDELGVSRPVAGRSVVFPNIRDLAARPDGSVVAAVSCDGNDVTFFEVEVPFEGSITAPHTIASEDRSQLFEFDDYGRHLRTRDPISGHVLWSFGSDALGRLTSFTDREGAASTSTIEYGTGTITVTAPGGLATTLTLDANGYATSIAGPNLASGTLARQTWTIGYQSGPVDRGLMTSFRAPGDTQAHTFTYEPVTGRLVTDVDLADDGGSAPSQELSESRETIFSELYGLPLDDVRQVTLTSEMDRERHFAMRRQGSEVWTRASVASGAFTERLDLGIARGVAEERLYDGSRISTLRSRDPVYDLDAAYVSRLDYCRPSALGNQAQRCSDVSPENRFQLVRTRSVVGSGVLVEQVTVGEDTWRAEYAQGARTVTLRAPSERTVMLSYDSEGRVSRIDAPDQFPVCVSYTGHRVSVIRQGNFGATCSGNPSVRRELRLDYASGGLRWLTRARSGHGADQSSTTFVPDSNRGVPTSVTLPGRTAATVLGYDAQNRLTRIVPAGHPPANDYVYSYTPRGFFLSEETPRTTQGDGTVYPESPLETSRALYSDDGELRQLDHRGTPTIALTREPATGHLAGVALPGESFTITPDELGRPTAMGQSSALGASTYSFTYDGQVPSIETIDVPGYAAELERQVSHQTGRLDAVIVRDDSTETALATTTAPGAPFDGTTPFHTASVARGGDTSPDLWLVGAPSVAPTPSSLHEVFRADIMDGTMATFRTQHGMDAFGATRQLMSGIPAASGPGVSTVWYRDMICERDNEGRILRRVEHYRDGAALSSLRYVYSYDDAGRLVGVVGRRHPGTAVPCTQSSGGTAIPGNTITTYDANTGNRLFLNRQYNEDDQLVREGPTGAVRQYRYDARGHLTSRMGGTAGNFTYAWSALDRLRSTTTGASTRTYQHDLFGRLVAIRGGGAADPDQFFVYRDGLEPVAWARGNVHQYYVYGSQRHVPDLIYEDSDADEQIDATYRVLTDERGSVRMVVRVDGAPTVVQRVEYDAWGVPAFAVGSPTTQPFGFAGAIWLAHPGWWHMGAREYDPSIGRWTSKDPIRFAGGTNLYGYCENDPVNCIDPSGLEVLLDLANALDWAGIDDFSAGFGSALTFGGTDALLEAATGRQANQTVDRCSSAHWWGEIGAIPVQFALGGAGSSFLLSRVARIGTGAWRFMSAAGRTIAPGVVEVNFFRWLSIPGASERYFVVEAHASGFWNLHAHLLPWSASHHIDLAYVAGAGALAYGAVGERPCGCD